MKLKHIKTPVHIPYFRPFAMALVLGLMLTACGGEETANNIANTKTTDKASTSDAKEAPKTTQASTTPQASEPKQATDVKPETPSPQTPPEQVVSDKPAVQALSLAVGQKRYETTCKICHDQGMLGSPKIKDKANWAKRLDKGIDTLHQHAAKGFGKMPAQANDKVSEAEVYAAVDYLVSQVQ